MANETSRGGQKQGPSAGGNSKQHRGVRPGSTSQDKHQRQDQSERKARKGKSGG